MFRYDVTVAVDCAFKYQITVTNLSTQSAKTKSLILFFLVQKSTDTNFDVETKDVDDLSSFFFVLFLLFSWS